ncbi:MAG TPA: hypothetical protein VNB03_14990 [Casimicrobiaceae bacterium]|jgi:hypothetical protein|nr:hypothetical protein [Casimicrobiaceae bacterium]
MKSILDPTFRYTPSTHTDIARTFARIRREQRLSMRIVQAPGAGSVRTLSLVARRATRATR